MKISFVIPFHNEEENVPNMLRRVINYAKSQKWNLEVIPVNDRSSDKTGEILDKWAKRYKFIHPVHREDGGELGNTMGLALKEGTKKAIGEVIIWTMGDLADDIMTYGDIVKKIKTGYDVVFGSRYMPGGSRGNLDPIKAFFSSKGTLLARILFGIPVHDITNAFRGFKKQVFNKIKLESSGFSISPEFAIKTHLAGFKLGEVPTVYYNRVAGISTFKIWKMSLAYLKVYLKLLLKK